MGTWCFSWMHSTGQKNNFFVFKTTWMTAMRKHKRIFTSLIFLSEAILGAYSHNFYFSAFLAVAEYIALTVDILSTFKLFLDFVKLFNWLLIRKRKGKCEVSCLWFWVAELVRKLEHEIWLVLKPITGFRNDPLPLFLNIASHPEHWFKTLGVEFWLDLD